mmetsp:Transcript_51014/g.101926  ORF Transcript_51014/g.101926 Transcript_51014/m.101926 type:complete len:336 (-) Transcript_51014:455-1462(-)
MEQDFFHSFIRTQIRIQPYSDFFWILFSRIEKKKGNFQISEKILEYAYWYFSFSSKKVLAENIKFGNFKKRKGLNLVFVKKNLYSEKIWFQFFFNEKKINLKKKILRSLIFFLPSNLLSWRIVWILNGNGYIKVEKKNLWEDLKFVFWTKVKNYREKQPFFKNIKRISFHFTKIFFSWITDSIFLRSNLEIFKNISEVFSALNSNFLSSLNFNIDLLNIFFNFIYPVGSKFNSVTEEEDISCLLSVSGKGEVGRIISFLKICQNQGLWDRNIKKGFFYKEAILKKKKKWIMSFFNEIFFSYQPFLRIEAFFFWQTPRKFGEIYKNNFYLFFFLFF